jgi:hypothetical protein
MRVLDQFGIEAPVDTARWTGMTRTARIDPADHLMQ